MLRRPKFFCSVKDELKNGEEFQVMQRVISKLIVFTLICTILLPIEAQAAAKEEKLTLIVNTKQYYQNGTVYLAQAPHTVKDGVTYVSMRSLADRLGYKVTYEPATNEYAMQKGNHKLSFKLQGKTYRYNGETRTIRSGQIHTLNGSLMIPLRETVTPLNMNIVAIGNKIEITWKNDQGSTKPATPLQVAIQLDKKEYKIGEEIRYKEVISGGSGKIVSKNWTNNEPAFFTPGEKTVSLEVKDENGTVSRAEAKVVITNEVLRTKEQFDALMTPIGDKMAINGDQTLTYPAIPFETIEKDFTLVRSNSPERITRDGIYYEDTLKGDARFLIHKQNARETSARIYLVAKNEGNTSANVELRHLGVGGPHRYLATNAKESLSNYYRSLSSFSTERLTLKPGEVGIIAEDKISKLILPEYTLTAYADVYSDQDILYQVIVLEEQNEFERVYPFLTNVSPSRDGRHTRGTFAKGNRTLKIDQLVGQEPGRLVFGDGKYDTYVTGYDHLSGGAPETNFGNRGVFYTMELNRVAPNTALVLNPRGGQYIGSFLVNGKVVITPNSGTIAVKNEAAILYRTGNSEEKVTIQFIPASGSNLPLNIVSIPLVK